MPNDHDHDLNALAARVQQLEHFTVEMSTSQRLALPEVDEDASAADVRTAVIEILAFLRALRLGA